MTRLPTGTVTFLFSDIEGSTRLARELGSQWSQTLTDHRAALREAFAAHGGVEVGTEGDSFFVAFSNAPAAVRAAGAAQRALASRTWPTDADVRVRMGLHTTGDARIVDGGYAGVDVHRAARIMSAGHGGQVLLSASTRSLVENDLDAGLRLLDLGEHRLKDLPVPESLAQLCVAGLQSEFPQLRSIDGARSNLPAQATTFIGREEEVDRVRALLRQNRLVTLTGPGGTGKTRLSLAVAEGETDQFPDGVFFVPLATIRETELVVPTLGKAIGVADPGPDPLKRLVEHLSEKRLLLVLDNLEQVVDAASDIGEVLQAAPDVSILATSRSALRVYGEQEYAVPPLPMPDPRQVAVDRSIVRYPAPALFVERARRVKPDFELTDDNAAAVAEICWRLDGLPLAIELAAARVRILSPQAMLARLGSSLDLGASGSRDLPERQQTLRGAIAWSHEILDEGERAFFAAFAVFAGGADLEAADAVLGAYAPDVLDALGALVDKSLLLQEELPDGAPRFRMLETIREYAEEQLAQRDDEAALRRAHAEHFVARTEAAAARIFTDRQKDALDRIEADHDNLRAALTWTLAAVERTLAMRLVTAAWRMWQMRGYLAEGDERAARVLALPGLDRHPTELAAMLEAAGGLAYWRADFSTARQHYDAALELQRRIGDDAAVANALYNVSMSFAIGGAPVPLDIPPDIFAKAREALAIYRRLGDRSGEGKALWALLDMEVLQLHHDAASDLGVECLRIFSETGDRFMRAWTEYMLGLNDNLRGDGAAARGHLVRALEDFRAPGDLSGYAMVLDGLAAAAFRDGDRMDAMRLAGGANAIQRQGGALIAQLNRQWARFDPEALLTDPELSAAWDEGRAMEIERLLELAVATARVPEEAK